MGESSASYIRMVQHLIEKCLQFKMNREECAEALSRHANIEPLITNTVWKELEKENKEFFDQYAKETHDQITVSKTESAASIQKLTADAAATQLPEAEDGD